MEHTDLQSKVVSDPLALICCRLLLCISSFTGVSTVLLEMLRSAVQALYSLY